MNRSKLRIWLVVMLSLTSTAASQWTWLSSGAYEKLQQDNLRIIEENRALRAELASLNQKVDQVLRGNAKITATTDHLCSEFGTFGEEQKKLTASMVKLGLNVTLVSNGVEDINATTQKLSANLNLINNTLNGVYDAAQKTKNDTETILELCYAMWYRTEVILEKVNENIGLPIASQCVAFLAICAVRFSVNTSFMGCPESLSDLTPMVSWFFVHAFCCWILIVLKTFGMRIVSVPAFVDPWLATALIGGRLLSTMMKSVLEVQKQNRERLENRMATAKSTSDMLLPQFVDMQTRLTEVEKSLKDITSVPSTRDAVVKACFAATNQPVLLIGQSNVDSNKDPIEARKEHEDSVVQKRIVRICIAACFLAACGIAIWLKTVEVDFDDEFVPELILPGSPFAPSRV